jgi:predicted ATP-grasp superfamily ATP-dependent carboligase
MKQDRLHVQRKPSINDASMVIGLSGWMDGGDVSTGTIEYLRQRLQADEIARIDPNGFYIYSMPGPMEAASLFRPHLRIEDGMIQAINLPEAIFYEAKDHNLLLFYAREPNLCWSEFADCIFEMCENCNVRRILFVGSVAGVTPHTREPRISCAVSNENLKHWLDQLGVRFSNYAGPGSFANSILLGAMQRNIEMISLVAEIPAYLQGYNPTCIEMAIKYVARILEIHIPVESLQALSDEFEKRVNELVKREPELQQRVLQLEERYDKELFETEMGDLKSWLEQRGLRVD